MPNISDKLKEFFGDPSIPGQAVEEVLMNAKAMGNASYSISNLSAIGNTSIRVFWFAFDLA